MWEVRSLLHSVNARSSIKHILRTTVNSETYYNEHNGTFKTTAPLCGTNTCLSGAIILPKIFS